LDKEKRMVFAMFVAALIGIQAQQVVVQGGPPPKPVPKNAPTTLPDTPQAKHVKAYIDAFNSGDAATFLKVQEAIMSPDALARRPAEQRATMYARLRGDFTAMKIKRVAAAADQIRAVIEDKDGNEAIFSFDFDARPPYKIKGIGIDIGNVER
jgi:hypothetical protein